MGMHWPATSPGGLMRITDVGLTCSPDVRSYASLSGPTFDAAARQGTRPWLCAGADGLDRREIVHLPGTGCVEPT
jgi:hypothetical protein